MDEQQFDILLQQNRDYHNIYQEFLNLFVDQNFKNNPNPKLGEILLKQDEIGNKLNQTIKEGIGNIHKSLEKLNNKETKVQDYGKLLASINRKAKRVYDTMEVIKGQERENLGQALMALNNKTTELIKKEQYNDKNVLEGIASLIESINNIEFDFEIDYDKLKKNHQEGIEKLLSAVFQIDIDKYQKPKEALAVKIYDRDGKIIESFGGGGGSSRVNIKNAADENINPATEEKQDSLLAKLQEIADNTDTLEISAENVNLNTDELEAKLDTLISFDYATETTLNNFNAKVITDTDDGSLAGGVDYPVFINLLYGRDGTTWSRIKSKNGAMVMVPNGGSQAAADGRSNTIVSITNGDGNHVDMRTIPFMFNGASWDRLRGTAADGLLVNLGANNNVTVDNFPTEISVNNFPSDFPDAAVLSELQDKLDEATFTARFGEVQATPTANTLLGRLKNIENYVDGLETELTSIGAEIDKLDTNLSFATVSKSTSSGDIIAAPGASTAIRIHHIAVNNHGANFTKFQIKDGSAGSIIRDFGLAAEGGLAEINLKRPLELTANTALYYTYESGASADISITIHYETISV